MERLGHLEMCCFCYLLGVSKWIKGNRGLHFYIGFRD